MTDPIEHSPILSTAQAAKRLGVNEQRIRQLIAEGRILATKLGRDWVIDADSVRSFVHFKAGRPSAKAS